MSLLGLDPVTGQTFQYENEEYLEETPELTENQAIDEFLYHVKFHLILKDFVSQTKGTKV